MSPGAKLFRKGVWNLVVIILSNWKTGEVCLCFLVHVLDSSPIPLVKLNPVIEVVFSFACMVQLLSTPICDLLYSLFVLQRFTTRTEENEDRKDKKDAFIVQNLESIYLCRPHEFFWA